MAATNGTGGPAATGPDGGADPLLVRPYILSTPDDLDRARPGETWPAPGASAAGRPASPAGRPASPAGFDAGGGRHADARGDAPADDGVVPVDSHQPGLVPGQRSAGDDTAVRGTAIRGTAIRGAGVRISRAGGRGAGGRGPGDAVPSRRRRRLRLIGAAAVTGTLAVAGAFAALRQDGDGTVTAAEPPAAVPTATAAPGDGASGAGVTSAAPSGGSTPPRRASTSATRAPSSAPARSPSTTPTAVATPGASAAPTPPAKATGQPVLPPTAPERSGTITGPGGRCLDVDGDATSRGHRLQVADCDGGAAQTWTLLADGTLRTAGRCGQAGNGGSVKLVDCDGQAVGRWRRDKNRSLLNVGTGNCLTDPDNGSSNGSAVFVRACDGGTDQQWSVP